MKTHQDLKRGKSKTVFSIGVNCVVGSKPQCYAPGVEPGQEWGKETCL